MRSIYFRVNVSSENTITVSNVYLRLDNSVNIKFTNIDYSLYGIRYSNTDRLKPIHPKAYGFIVFERHPLFCLANFMHRTDLSTYAGVYPYTYKKLSEYILEQCDNITQQS